MEVFRLEVAADLYGGRNVRNLPDPRQPVPPTTSLRRLARFAVPGFVVVFTVSACSVLGASEPLAIVPAPATDDQSPDVVVDQGSLSTEASTEAAEASPPPVSPALEVVKLKPRPKPGPFSIDLYEAGDFMHQQTKDWCVAGSTQTMMNIIDTGKPNRSPAFQKKLYAEGRRLSHNQQKLGQIGMDLTGWMELLNTRGYGPYTVDGGNTRVGAIRKAARALRMTGKPVGLVTWRGAHSWVMSGFTATADPAYSKDFVVQTVFIQDVWYPYVSTIWGASRPPGAAVPVAALAEDYLPYRRPGARYPKRDGRFMLILPTLPPDTIAR